MPKRTNEDDDDASFYDDELEGDPGTPLRPPLPLTALSENAIIAALQISMRMRGLRITALRDKSPAYTTREFIEGCFGTETISEVGMIIIEALLDGDKRMVSQVKQAIKEADHLFNRDRELVLLERVFKYVNGDGAGLDVVTLKKEIEKRFNRGKQLDQHRWSRLRKQLFLPTRPTGRPKNPDTDRK